MLFVVIARDKPAMSEVRARTRPAHLEYMARLGGPGRHIIGMPLATDDQSTMTGSLYLMEATDRAAAEAFAAGDPYARAGVFASTEVIAVHPAFAGDLARIRPKGDAG